MFKNLKDLKFIFNKSGIQNLNYLFFLIILNSIFEIISIGMLIPFVTSIVSDDFLDKMIIIMNSIGLKDLSENLIIKKDNFYMFFIFFLIFLYFLKYFFNLLFNYYCSFFKVHCEKKISEKLLKIFYSTQSNTLFEIPTSKILHDFNIRVNALSSGIFSFANLFCELIILSLIIIFLIFVFDIKFIIIFFALASFSIIFFFIKNKITAWSKERGVGGDDRNKNILDYFEGLRELIIYQCREFLLEDFKYNNNKYLNPQKKIIFLNTIPKIFFEFVTIVIILSYLSYSLVVNINPDEAIKFLLITGVVFSRTLPSINRILINYSNIKYLTDPINKIKKFFEFNASSKLINDKQITFEENITLKDICFQYAGEEDLFKNINFTIKKDLKIGIFGKSGSGKSTLIDLIVGLKKPKSGQIILDKTTVLDKRYLNWINKISYVSQRSFIFNTSLRNNITLASDNKAINQYKFQKILEILDLKKFIQEKKEKEFYIAGEFGNNLSGGQRQKIGLARAIYSDRPIIILDESTNSLDDESEMNIINQIEKFEKKTIIFITHNLKNFENFDQIYKLENNKLIKVK